MKNSDLLKKIRKLEDQLRKLEGKLYAVIERGRLSEEEANRLRFENSTLRSKIQSLNEEIDGLKSRLK